MFSDYLTRKMNAGGDFVDAMVEIADAQSKTSLFFSIIKSLFPEETDILIANKSMEIVNDFRKNNIYPKSMNEKIVLVLRTYIKQKGGYPNDPTGTESNSVQ